MIKRLSSDDVRRFEAICASLSLPLSESGDSIGTFNEKRVHRAIKRFISEDESSYEIKVGSAVADVLSGGIIYEIQTSSFRPLTKKVAAYLAEAKNEIRIIHPIVVKNRIVRLDTSTGEVLRTRTMNMKRTARDILPELIYLSDHLKNPRLCFDVYLIETEERRYSDTVYRYRKKGRRDSEVFPVTIREIISLETTDDFLALLPDSIKERAKRGESFTAAEFSRESGLLGRDAYLALGALTAIGILESRKDGRKAAAFKFI
ncbi:MAG: hypothetical protein IKB02_10090 [Clostridia bacterium]|nr:hypothetical protein [Clostridia bacterium]MBR2389082.1 hypothetical protein [Clostridia bacterium]